MLLMQTLRIIALPLAVVVVAGAAVGLLANVFDVSGGIGALGVIAVAVLAGLLGADVAEKLPSSRGS